MPQGASLGVPALNRGEIPVKIQDDWECVRQLLAHALQTRLSYIKTDIKEKARNREIRLTRDQRVTVLLAKLV